MTLNENIKRFRKEAGLTQKALAGKSGLSFSMISKLESGEQSNPSFETIKKIADVLKISPGKLVSTPMSIEDQIDEYLEYKRGINRNVVGTAVSCGAADHKGLYSDLNFKKKMQAINNFPIPADDYTEECSDYPDIRPEIKKLFYVLKNATRDEINQITRLIETFRGV